LPQLEVRDARLRQRPYGYVSGLTVSAHVFVLNKRFVSDRSVGLLDCGREFHLANNPDQWVTDYSEFVTVQLSTSAIKFKNIVLVVVSEGAWPATKVAGLLPAITHLAIIGSGGDSMRKSLATLKQKGAISFDVELYPLMSNRAGKKYPLTRVVSK